MVWGMVCVCVGMGYLQIKKKKGTPTGVPDLEMGAGSWWELWELPPAAARGQNKKSNNETNDFKERYETQIETDRVTLIHPILSLIADMIPIRSDHTVR
jgi:hypothetical protein